jgi:succinate-acetate transporter protein
MSVKRNEATSIPEVKPPALGNPAAVGLGAFGATTLLLQFHNLGWAGSGIVMWLAIAFGGLAQLIAGLQEFKTGNSFGYAAFSTYGAFWIAVAGIFLSSNLKVFSITSQDIGLFMVVFTVMTFIYFIGAMKQSAALSVVFLTLLLGYIFLDIHFLANSTAFKYIAAIDLIICAFSALYLMAHVIYANLGINLPIGRGWTKK